ncbi:hypothetical protein WMF37_06385 [Sorangium sp. So ce291]|uniref:hypothetical protein n=1 Tax=Sorangium sp. So ce291 TaxID=3133294 RepID=UPI003F626443
MTILEELVQIVRTLGAEEQRQVLDLATQLRDARPSPDVSLVDAGTDDASWSAWRERIRTRSTLVLEEEKQRLRTLGLIDEHWNAQTDELPADMLPSSKSSVET